MLMNKSKRIERLLVLVRSRDFRRFSGVVMIGHVEVHDGFVLLPGKFMIVVFVGSRGM